MESVPNAEDTSPIEIDDRRRIPDRRASSRRKLIKGGRTFWANCDFSECIVYNLSTTGARLELRGPAPNVFDLVVDGDGVRQSCLVVWRKANRVGVQFKEPSALPAPAEKSAKQAAEFRQYVDECRALAERADPSDRAILLEMSDAWTAIVQQLHKKAR